LTSIVGWTGHRPELFADPSAARAAVLGEARSIGAKRFVVGGQRGVDTWAAEAAIELSLPFTLLMPLPFEQFTADWLPADRDTLLKHTKLADDVRIAGGYTERNRMVASSCNLLVAVWTGRRGGGTAETIEFAIQFGTPIRETRLAASSATGFVAERGI
jgi:YspA SLOG family